MNAPETRQNSHRDTRNSTPPSFSTKQRLLLALVPPLATLLIRLLCLTLRFETRAEDGACPADTTPGPDVYAFWHRCLLLAAYRYRDLGIRILISQSFDGELIARIVERLGFIPVRGSSSRGGAAGLLALSRALASGHKVAITVDGPRGPCYVVKPGAAAVASRQARVPSKSHADGQAQRVSPFYLSPARHWTLRSWDRFLIPKPFSRVTCIWTTPVLVQADTELVDIDTELQAALDRAVAETMTEAA